MNARRKIESVLADIFGQYLANSGFPVLPGRGNSEVVCPYFCVVAKTVKETVRGSGVYLGDIQFIVVTDSNAELSAAQDTRIGQCMDVVRRLSNTLCSGDTCITDDALAIIVEGMAQVEQADMIDDQSFGDKVSLTVGFRETDIVPAVAPAPNAPQIIPAWWTESEIDKTTITQ